MANATKRGAAKLLRKAAKIVDTKWCQGSWHKNGAYCALGALNTASGLSPGGDLGVTTPNRRLAGSAVMKVLGTKGIISFNDEPGRTSDDVSSLFRRAARELEHGMELSY